MAEEDGEPEKHGPFFDSDVDLIIDKANKEASEDIADALLNRWREVLEGRMRDSHGRYISSLTKSRDGEFWHVHDGIEYEYGPWLEGKGSRNRTTRFGGYNSLEDATVDIQGEAGDILEKHVAEAVRELN